MSITSKAKAEAVQESLGVDIIRVTEGNGLTKKNGSWVVVLYIADEVPTGTFPSEIDGVEIMTEVIGKIEIHAK